MRKTVINRWIAMAAILLVTLFITAGRSHAATASPRVEWVAPAARQPAADDAATLWFDDFDGPEKAYGEADGPLDDSESLGGHGKSLLSHYPKGSQGKDKRIVFFGDSPTGGKSIVRKGEKFDEIHWRVYVKHQLGWRGGGEAKLSRVTSFASAQWAQAMIAHVWSGKGDVLTLDPASGVRGDQVVTTRYNDFEHLHWLGNRPEGRFAFSSTDESGWWVCVESSVKLNTPSKSDGVNRLWIDGRLECERTNLNLRGGYSGHGVNAVMLETYWNDGSPVEQSRWLDHFVVSTRPIGPVTCPRNPTMKKAAFEGDGNAAAWELELAADASGTDVTWKSNTLPIGSTTTVDARTGAFVGTLAGKDRLAPAAEYWCRVRQKNERGEWSAWSAWHQHFKTEK